MDIAKYQDEFPIVEKYNFMNHAGVAPISRRAADAIRHYADMTCRTADLEGGFYQRAELVRQSAAKLIHADATEVTFVKNTTEGISFVANGLSWKSGDNVIITNVEFPANVYPWWNLESRGVQVRRVEEADGRIPLERLIDMIDTRTRVVAISAVQYASGFRTDLAALGKVCRERGVLLCVDVIQALGVMPIDVQAMNIDFLSADGHNWMCGPEGCGLFYCRRELFDRVQPTTVGWLCMKNALDFGNYQFEFLDDARRFDCGSYNLPGICGLGAAIDLLLEAGIDHISRRVLTLTDRLIAGVKDKGYRIVSSRRDGEASGIVAFTSDRHNHTEIQQRLKAEHRIIIAVREGRLRVSPHFYNREEQIDQLINLLPGH